MRRLILVLVLLLPFTPAAAQSGTWCRAFDFRNGMEGWALSYNGTYGRYNTDAGFTVSDYYQVGPLSYEDQASIRIHRDFSGTLTQMVFYVKNPDFDYVFVDYNSLVSDAEPLDDDVFEASGTFPVVITINPRSVSGRLGLEFVNTDAGATKMIVFGIILSGTGSNPFGNNNCQQSTADDSAGEGASQPYEAVVNVPFPELFAGIAEANVTINSLPNDLTAPNGISLLPGTNGSQVFAYAKWLLSPSAADEYAGPVAPIIQHQAILVSGMMALIVVYVAIYLVVWGIRFIIWLTNWAFRLFDLIMQILQAGGSLIVDGVQALLRALSR